MENFEGILLELFARVQALEQTVARLQESGQMHGARKDEQGDRGEDRDGGAESARKSGKQVTTEDVCSYILQKKKEAVQNRERTMVLRAGDIERDLGTYNRIPIIVNAMKQMKGANDETLLSTRSGYSASFTVCYHLDKEERRIMRGRINHFVIRKGISPYTESMLPSLKVVAGEEYLLVYDDESRCVGVVYCHSERRAAAANGQAEICFFDCYYAEYGRWHRMFRDGLPRGERISYEELLSKITTDGRMEYSGYIRM